MAMEIFAAARLETTERAKFVGIVSILEPIAVQERYENEELTSLLEDFKKKLDSSGLDPSLKASLRGRIDQLTLESVTRAIRTLIKESLPEDSDAVEIIEEAYNLRRK